MRSLQENESIQKLAASSEEEIDFELLSEYSVKDIMKAIKENRKSAKR